jgi:hypothetical protein
MNADQRMFSGATVMAACACGTASGIASIATGSGLPTVADATYPVIVGIGGALFLSSLIDRRAAWLPGLAGVAAFAGAIALAPQSSMHGVHAMTMSRLTGFALYYAAAALLITAALRAYMPARRPQAAVALSGIAMATGCTCCLTPGAAHYMGIAAGLSGSTWMLTRAFFLSLGVAVTSIGLLWARRPSAILYSLSGALIAYFGEIWIEQLFPTLNINGMNLTFVLRYPFWLAGAGLLVMGASRALASEPVRDTPRTLAGDIPATASA